jgi:hypothetical protein
LTKATTVNDHVNIDIRWAVEGLGDVPTRHRNGLLLGLLKPAGTADEYPALPTAAFDQNCFAQRAITVCLRYARQPLPPGGRRDSPQDGLVSSGIAVREQNRPRPGKCKTDGQGGNTR